MQFQQIIIIYNPNSTGDSPSIAKEFYAQVRRAFPTAKTKLQGTNYAGHAEVLAYDAARAHPGILIVSVSGDGGYNEVINGAMRAMHEHKATPVCAILPGGNANDHHSSVSERPLIEAMRKGDISRLDLLAVSYEDTIRYAHSYIGLGLTPLVAKELNKYQLNRFREIWLAIKSYFTMRAFYIIRHGQTIAYDSILMVVIARMAKHLKLAPGRRPTVGSFDLFQVRHRSKRKLISMVVRSLLGKHIPHRTVTEYTFTTTDKLTMQLDGELLELPSDTEVIIKIAPRRLRTLI